MKVHHLGILVKDIHAARATYAHLFQQAIPEIHQHQAQQIFLCCFQLENLLIELIAPDSEDSPMQKILIKRGEGIHHIALEGESVPKDLNWIYAENKIGEFHSQINFIHPASTHGVLVEVCKE